MRARPAILAGVLALSATACGGGGGSRPSASSHAVARASIEVSSDFRSGASIPRVHTCDGRDVSPPLHVAGLPGATKELVVVMRDPDAPGGNFIHWEIAHLEPSHGSLSLASGVAPAGTVLGRNSYGSLGYRGPCPPSGPAHHYVITVYALGQASGLGKGFSPGDVATLPVLAQGTLTGPYARR